MRPTLKRSTSTYLKYLIILALFSIIFIPSCYAIDLLLRWRANSEPILGYKIYYKTVLPGPPYYGYDAVEGPSPIAIPLQDLYDPSQPEYVVHGLDENETYYFVLTAYNQTAESAYSSEYCFNCDDYNNSDNQAYGVVENSESSSGCFIATAAYGSILEPQVKILREFRDKFMLSNKLGKWFINLYYKHSPPIAKKIGSHEALKAIVRIGLLPVVGLSWIALKIGITAVGAIVFLMIAILIYCKGSRVRIQPPDASSLE
jgi:hypothetical protein